MEKEIESAIYFELRLAQTDESDWEEQASKDIAQAVAEKMRKGMVWKDIVKFEIDREGDLGGWSVEHGDYVVYMPRVPEAVGILPGKSYRVTFRKVEGASG